MWVAKDCAMANIVASMLEKTTCMYGYNHIIKVSHPLETKHCGVVYIVARLACLSWNQIFFSLCRREELEKLCALLRASPLVAIPIEQPQAPSFDESNEIYIKYKFQTK